MSLARDVDRINLRTKFEFEQVHATARSQHISLFVVQSFRHHYDLGPLDHCADTLAVHFLSFEAAWCVLLSGQMQTGHNLLAG